MSFAFFHSFFKKEHFFYQDQISTMLRSMPGKTQNFNIIDEYALGSTHSNSNIFKLNNTLIILDGFIFNSEELSKMYSSVPYSLYSFSDVSERKYEKVRRENKIKKQTNRTGTVRIVGY